MYTPLAGTEIRSAFNNSLHASKLYEAIAKQFDTPEYLVEPEYVEIRRVFTAIVATLRSGIDHDIQRTVSDELERVAVILYSMKRPSKKREAFQAYYDNLMLASDDMGRIYYQVHAWDD